jgi:hypothetical protein
VELSQNSLLLQCSGDWHLSAIGGYGGDGAEPSQAEPAVCSGNKIFQPGFQRIQLLISITQIVAGFHCLDWLVGRWLRVRRVWGTGWGLLLGFLAKVLCSQFTDGLLESFLV